jgi:hypothetical protein
MDIIKSGISFAIKTALVLWGIACTLLGSAQAVGIDPDARHSGWAGPFVFLSYSSVLVIGMFGLIWSRIVSKLLLLSALLAITILVFNEPSANGLGLGLSVQSALIVILRGPVLAGLILFAIYRFERTQETSRPADPV